MKHRVVRSGTWLYDGTVKRPIYIVELDYDFWFEMCKGDGFLEPGEKPELNADGFLYYVCFWKVPKKPPIQVDSVGHDSIHQTSEYAQSKVPTQISWNQGCLLNLIRRIKSLFKRPHP